MLKTIILVTMLGLAFGRPQGFQQPPASQGASSAQSGAGSSGPGQSGPGQSGPGPAQPQAPHSGNSSTATVVKSEFVDDGAGTFRWAFETSDGFKAEQSGQTLPPGMARSGAAGAPGEHGSEDEEGGGESVKGSYSYNAPDGQLISVTYVADKNGFQPVGAHIPTPPPNPHAAAAAPGAAGPAGPAGPAGQAPASAAPSGGSSSGSQSFASDGSGPPAVAQAGNPQNPQG